MFCVREQKTSAKLAGDWQASTYKSYTAPIRNSVRPRTEFPKRTMTSGRRIFFFPFPSPSFLSPIDHPLGRNIYLSPTFLCFENPIREELLNVRLPKIRLHCRLQTTLLVCLRLMKFYAKTPAVVTSPALLIWTKIVSALIECKVYTCSCCNCFWQTLSLSIWAS